MLSARGYIIRQVEASPKLHKPQSPAKIKQMTTQTIVKKLNREIETLQDDVKQVKKVLFSTLYDTEGEYKESFIKKILTRSKRSSPYHFLDKKGFLKHVRSAK